MDESTPVVVLISADIEWQAVCSLFPHIELHGSPLGEWLEMPHHSRTVIFFHGGWGKISAAASTQYVIDRWKPKLILNLGTCGGFAGRIEKGTILLVERTIVYDILEQMGDFDAHIAHYSTDLDLTWLDEAFPGGGYPAEVLRGTMLSADRDLLAEEIPGLICRYGGVVGDWESGAIAWVTHKNQVRCLILRGVTDLVGEAGGEAYAGNIQVFIQNTAKILEALIAQLPGWIAPFMTELHEPFKK